MSDWDAKRLESQGRRRRNREASLQLLRERGVEPDVHNNGAHLVIAYRGRTVDFWPGTGKYIFRKEAASGHGVFNLLKELGL